MRIGFWVIAFVFLVAAPSPAPSSQKAADAAQQNSHPDKRISKSSPSSTPSANKDTAQNTSNQNGGTVKGNENERAVWVVGVPPRSTGDTIALFCTIVLTLAAIAGIIVGICTLCTLKRQTRAIRIQGIHMGRQTALIRKSVETAQESMDFQKTIKTQWVDLENWSAKAPWTLNDPALLVTIFYEIVNPTEMPLTVKRVEVSTGSGRETSASEYTLNPKARKLMSVPFSFTDKERIDLFFGRELVINIFGTVTFKNNFGKLQRQLFGEVCKGGVGEHDGENGFSFERFDAWLPSEDDEGDNNP